MNLAFVYSMDDVQSAETPLRTQEQIHFGISYISSFVKKHGHTSKLIVLSKVLGDAYKAVIDRYIREFKPGLLCFTAVNSNKKAALRRQARV